MTSTQTRYNLGDLKKTIQAKNSTTQPNASLDVLLEQKKKELEQLENFIRVEQERKKIEEIEENCKKMLEEKLKNAHEHFISSENKNISNVRDALIKMGVLIVQEGLFPDMNFITDDDTANDTRIFNMSFFTKGVPKKFKPQGSNGELLHSRGYEYAEQHIKIPDDEVSVTEQKDIDQLASANNLSRSIQIEISELNKKILFVKIEIIEMQQYHFDADLTAVFKSFATQLMTIGEECRNKLEQKMNLKKDVDAQIIEYNKNVKRWKHTRNCKRSEYIKHVVDDLNAQKDAYQKHCTNFPFDICKVNETKDLLNKIILIFYEIHLMSSKERNEKKNEFEEELKSINSKIRNLLPYFDCE